ncbi:MAG: hypothetical protein KDA91_04710 [Planctomycetaceae bacterium]|nr:hypothetical protein [Planctomycetaceae bacterium]
MLIRSFVVSASLIAALFTANLVQGQEDLRWKLKTGESLKYIVRQSIQQEMTIAGNKQSSLMQQTMDMGWDVVDVGSTGDATVKQSMRRIQMKMNAGAVAVEFDTSSTQVPDSPTARIMADVFRKIIDAEFVVTMRPSGEIKNVEVPKGLLESITSGLGPNPLFTEDTLRQTMQKTTVTLPEKTIKAGESWDSSHSMDMPLGSMKIDAKLTYEGKDPKTGLARISVVPTVSFSPKENSPAQIEVMKSEGKGQVLFDSVQGRIIQSDLNLTLELRISQAGQVVNQTVVQTTNMNLEK